MLSVVWSLRVCSSTGENRREETWSAGCSVVLVSRDCVVAGALWCGEHPLQHSWHAKTVHFSIYYDSLIEKCSTLSVVCACTGLTLPFHAKSEANEWNSCHGMVLTGSG
jgi:hypothetical protein